jgi:hypothetical protein
MVQIAPRYLPHPKRKRKTTYGAIALILMPDVASSRAAAFVIPITACLLAQYTLQFGFPTNPAIEAALTMEPPPTSPFATRMLRSSADMQRNVPWTLTAKTAS